MLNPLKNPLVVRTVLEKAGVELNQALKYRKKQFDDETLYMWVEIDKAEDMPYISLRNSQTETLIKMTGKELLQDEAIQQQLNKVPFFVRKFIKFDKIVPLMNNRLKKELKPRQYLKVTEGEKIAVIELWEENKILEKGLTLQDLFG